MAGVFIEDEDFAAADTETFFAPPPYGRRVRVDDEITVVLQGNRTRRALVALTVVPSLDEPV